MLTMASWSVLLVLLPMMVVQGAEDGSGSGGNCTLICVLDGYHNAATVYI